MSLSLYLKSTPDAVGHALLEACIDKEKEQKQMWRHAFRRVREHFGLSLPGNTLFYFDTSTEQDAFGDPWNMAIFGTTYDLKPLLPLIEAKGFTPKILTRSNVHGGRTHLKLDLKKKADRKRFAEITGMVKPEVQFRKLFGKSLEALYPDLKGSTWLMQPAMRKLSDGSWLITIPTDTMFGHGNWPELLKASGFEQLKASAAMALIEAEEEAKKAVTA